MPSFMVGKRSADNARRFMMDVAGRLVFPNPHASDAHSYMAGGYKPITQISTDGFPAYPEAVDLAFGPYVEFGTIIKEYRNANVIYSPSEMVGTQRTGRRNIGENEKRTICTSHVERLNCTQRVFLKRLNRLTLCFSKKLKNLEAAFGMFAAYYNFCWQTRKPGKSGQKRATAALMAGLTGHVWSFDELFSAVLMPKNYVFDRLALKGPCYMMAKAKKTTRPQGRCIFCDGHGLTKEHIWSDWLKSELNQGDYTCHYIGSVAIDHAAKTAYRSGTVKTIQGRMNQVKLRKVCLTCNNGWMGKLVNESKPFVQAMIRGKSTILNCIAKKDVAAWIAISTIMAEFTDHANKIVVPSSDRQLLMTSGAPPESWSIYLGKYDGTALGAIWHHHCTAGYYDDAMPASQGPVTFSSPGLRKFQITTYVLGSLLIQAFSAANDNEVVADFRTHMSSSSLVQIWPNQSESIEWPPIASVFDADIARLATGFREIQLNCDDLTQKPIG